MAHVHIGPDGLFVDGQQVPVLAENFAVDLRDLPRATVRCTIPADTLDIDLPDAVLEVKREGEVVEEIRLVRALLEGINQSAARASRERGRK